MSKTVDLNRIPKWEVGKWYYFEIALEWVSLVTYTKKESYNYPMIVSVSNRDYTRAFTHSGLHALEDKTRTLLEPWEALAMYPECKESAPEGVDWSENEKNEPTPEQIKSATEAFKGVDTEKYMAFIRGDEGAGDDVPWIEATESENATEMDMIKRENNERIESEMFHIKAENKELKNEVQKLNIMLETESAGIVENFKEKTRLAEENEKLSTQLKDRNIKIQALSESANDLSYDLTQAQILIGKLALKLQDAGDL